MHIKQTLNSTNNLYFPKNTKVPKNTFENFVPQNSVYPKVPLGVSKAYAAPQIYPEYKLLETFKLPNTGEGKVYRLRNGHNVIVLPKKGPTFINTEIGAGVINLPVNKKETAHILEHLLATVNYKNDSESLNNIASEMNIETNASTSHYSTNYNNKAYVFDDNDLEKLIKLHFNIIAKPDFSQKDIDHEKTTIYNEMVERYDYLDDDYNIANIANKNLLNLNENSPLLNNKDASSVKNTTQDDLHNFYQKLYRPDNMYTAIVGNVDENTIQVISKYFNQQKNPIIPLKRPAEEHLFDNPIQKAVRVDTTSSNKYKENCSINLDFLLDKSDDPSADIKLAIIRKIFIDKWLGSPDEIKINDCRFSNSFPNKSNFRLSFPVAPQNVELSIQESYDAINKLQTTCETEEELKQAKESVKDNLTFEFSELLALEYSNNLMFSKLNSLEKTIKMIDSITSEDIRNAMKKYLDLNKVLLTVMHPQEKNKDISFKGNLKIQDMLNIKEYVLPNNINVLFNESDNVSESTINFKLNAIEDIPAHSEAVRALSEVIPGVDAEIYCKDKNITIDKKINKQQIELMLNSTPKNIMKMISLAINTIINPTPIDPQKFEEWKHNNATIKRNPTSVYQKYTNEFFKDTPFIYEREDINDLQIQDIQNLHSSILNNAQATVCITVPKSESEKYKKDILDNLNTLQSFKPFNYSEYFNKIEAKPLTQNKMFVEKNNDNTVYIEKSYKIIKSGNVKDIVGLNVLKCLLGDYEKGILFNKLRIEKNLVYSVFSKYPEEFYAPNLGKMTLGTNIIAEHKNCIKEVLQEFEAATNKLQTELVDNKTLEQAKKRYKCVMMAESAFGQNVLLTYAKNSFYGVNFFSELEKAIDALTPNDIRELAKYYFSQPSLYMISGNKEAIELNMDYLQNLGEIF